MEYLLFPKSSYYLTQGYDGSTHKGTHALDISAANGGKYEIYMPFSGYVSKLYVPANSQKSAYTCWITSNDKVICADGVARYAVVKMTHPSEIKNLKLKQKFNQGDVLLYDGNTGTSTGRHLHFEVAVFDTKEEIKVGWQKNQYGNYPMFGTVDMTKYMVMKDDYPTYKNTYNGTTYTFKKVSEVVIAPKTEYTTGTYQTLANVAVRKGAGTNFAIKKVKELTADGKKNATSKLGFMNAYYKKGTKFTALEIIKISDNEYWSRGFSGYVCIVKGSTTCCKKIS